MFHAEPLILLAVAAVMIYAASRTAAQALSGTMGAAVGHFIPIAGTALVATWAGLDALAMNILFGASVMIITLVIGVSLWTAPVEVQTGKRRAWAWFVPMAVMTWMAASIGAIDPQVACGLIVVGGVIGWMVSGSTKLEERRHKRLTAVRWIIVILSLVLAAMASVTTVMAVQQILKHSHSLGQGIVAATVVAPLLVLPILGSATESALTDGSSAAAIGVCVGTAMLNLCLGLPFLLLMRSLREKLAGTDPTWSFPVPYGVWRIDSMLLIIGGFFLVPIGLGRWSPKRPEGLLLILVYIIYLFLVSPLNV